LGWLMHVVAEKIAVETRKMLVLSFNNHSTKPYVI